jgi:hypothetical protein
MEVVGEHKDSKVSQERVHRVWKASPACKGHQVMVEAVATGPRVFRDCADLTEAVQAEEARRVKQQFLSATEVRNSQPLVRWKM